MVRYSCMKERTVRTEMLISQKGLDILSQCRVAVFGVGGVGGYVVEALARIGIGKLDIIDDDCVVESNLNRQIIATYDTIGKVKVDAMKQRILSINPDCQVTALQSFYLPDKKDLFDFAEYDYIVDAIDTVTAKISLIEEAQASNVPIISAMGCGNRLDPSKLTVTDIYKTVNDPLAKVMRHELKKRHIRKLKVVYSTELPLKPLFQPEEKGKRRDIPGSAVFVPASAGLLIGYEVCRDLLEGKIK